MTKEYLKKMRMNYIILKKLDDEIDYLAEKIERDKHLRSTDLTVSQRNTLHTYKEIYRDIEKRITRFRLLVNKIEDPLTRNIVILHDMKGKTFKSMEKDLNYTYSSLSKKYKKFLETLDD